ncbi:calcium-binding protein [Limnoraphis robusta Tam1]|uniref:calcium-binding protein n=1 Tax=Limnoraphis robusta TaxID=1118279 RepID=UPI002B1F9315|nr:calcium-binding protein [Limnoraphis robusta]MEA5538204.1 calcium-binding protein [Limnoraphis robusta Tam1]
MEMTTTFFPSDELRGTEGDDLLEGTSRSDLIYGEDGNDILRGLQGSDFLDGGNGNDLVYGGRGDDQLEGGNGSDLLLGGRGNDRLFGGEFDSFGSPFPPESTPDSQQIDILLGGQDADTFVLSTFGAADEALEPYLGDGFALIGDFNRSQGDKIDLLGLAANNDYIFNQTLEGTEIFLGEDLIAVVVNATINPATDVNFVSQLSFLI